MLNQPNMNPGMPSMPSMPNMYNMPHMPGNPDMNMPAAPQPGMMPCMALLMNIYQTVTQTNKMCMEMHHMMMEMHSKMMPMMPKK